VSKEPFDWRFWAVTSKIRPILQDAGGDRGIGADLWVIFLAVIFRGLAVI